MVLLALFGSGGFPPSRFDVSPSSLSEGGCSAFWLVALGSELSWWVRGGVGSRLVVVLGGFVCSGVCGGGSGGGGGLW